MSKEVQADGVRAPLEKSITDGVSRFQRGRRDVERWQGVKIREGQCA